MPRTSTPGPLRLLPAFLLCSAFATSASAQSTGWAPRPAFVATGAGSTPEGSATLATDVARGLIVSFGAYAQGGSIADTWEWGGTVWTPRASTPVPPPRVGAQLVNDPSRRRTVLFGGSDPGTINLRGDTWEWDGTSWVQRVLPMSPSPRERYGIAFDAARGRIVLYGGRIVMAGVGGADTWEYDGITWTQRNPANAPGWRQNHLLAYDAARQRTVMFGGYPIIQNETWEWDGTNWSLRPTAIAPAVRVEHTMLYDAVRQRTVVCGGYNFVGAGGTHQDTWEWDGTAWQQRAVSLPFARTGLQAASDPATGAALAFDAGTVWRWNGTSWAVQQPMSWPPKHELGTAAGNDTLRNRVVSLGRWTGQVAQPLTWEWDGITWTRAAASGPTFAVDGRLAFDAARGLTVLFGNTETWEWNGSVWTLRSLAASPPGRTQHALAYDAARQRIVLFGGEYFLPMQGPQYLADTWTYDGAQWLQQSTASAPAARSNHAMAYDTNRQRVVLFGGNVFSNLFDDTWEWDGTSWTASAPTTRPSARLGHAMTFEPQSSTVVLFGGAGASTSTLRDDTWQWDGTVWSQRVLSRSPTPRMSHAMTIDPATGQVLMHGGVDFPSGSIRARDDTWLLGTPVTAAAAALGSACAAGAPPVLASPTPYLGNSDFRLEIRDTAAAAPCLLGFSFGAQAQPFGPCTLYLQNTVASTFLLANAWGVARSPLPLPYASWLRGLSFTAQAGVLANPGAFAGVDLTAALTIVVGD